jgi:hypothetical protein
MNCNIGQAIEENFTFGLNFGANVILIGLMSQTTPL